MNINKNSKSPSIESIEEYILIKNKKVVEDSLGVPRVIERNIKSPNIIFRDEKEFRETIKQIDYWHFIQSADYHYFISRILFLHHIPEYSYFCGEQCIENYLKAYIKYKGNEFQLNHNLRYYLDLCCSVEPNIEFFQDDRILIIISIFEPFNELARYPVQKRRPKEPLFFMFPDDIYMLDYFVFKMRELLTIPSNTWDILKKGHYHLHQCKLLFPEFYEYFFKDNINIK